MRNRFAKGIPGVVISSVMVGVCLAGDAVRSGPPPGEQVGAFQVNDITGPNRGRPLCYRCRYGPDPVICVFARKTTESLANLVKQIDEKISKNFLLKSFVVLIPKKGENLADDLKKLARDAGIRFVPLTIAESPNGPPDYDLAPDGDFTVLMWKEGKVRVNHGFKGELTDKDIAAILADIPKVLAR